LRLRRFLHSLPWSRDTLFSGNAKPFFHLTITPYSRVASFLFGFRVFNSKGRNKSLTRRRLQHPRSTV
jgi:hypothetical protein